MRHYYDIFVPLAGVDCLTFYSSEEAVPGCRVVVNVNHRDYTGIIASANPSPTIEEDKIKPIFEIVDETPIASADLLRLVRWISTYYREAPGVVMFAMLPGGFAIQTVTDIRLLTGSTVQAPTPLARNILGRLDPDTWTRVSDLKGKRPPAGFYAMLDRLEETGLIEARRNLDPVVKPTIRNILVVNPHFPADSLTPKQREAFLLMISIGNEFPLESISETVTASILKNLRKAGAVSLDKREQHDKPAPMPQIAPAKPITPTSDQSTAIAEITEAMNLGRQQTFLLHGVTGSGKTEVYIRVVKHALTLNRGALMLVPEISLTPQTVEKFYGALGRDIAILHSGLSTRERLQAWKDIASGHRRIVIGARSAIFAPISQIGVIIVDEEHENSYKQDNTPHYNARDIAHIRAGHHKAALILGSATPSLESWRNREMGKSRLLSLPTRPNAIPMPTVYIEDMKAYPPHTLITPNLKEKIVERINRREQVILFHNRRGHSSFIQCLSCGQLIECPHCRISLTYHSHDQELVCHYCGLRKRMEQKCPQCGSYLFSFGSPGTQRIENDLKLCFPQARILRMDSDTTRRRGSHQSMFDRMKQGHIDILLGTQMIAKGLDFDNVTLVGVISADVMLNVPDFRSAERTFQLLTQVSGRAGRGNKPGEVIIQSVTPEHYAIETAVRQDFPGFADIELPIRQSLFYPPFSRMVRVLFAAFSQEKLFEIRPALHQVADKIRRQAAGRQLEILGPVPAPLEMLNGLYRHHLVIKADSVNTMSMALRTIQTDFTCPGTIRMTIDVDPSSLM